MTKYIHLAPGHLFSQLTVETMGVLVMHQGTPQGNGLPDDPGHGEGGSNHLPHPETIGGSAAGQLMTKL